TQRPPEPRQLYRRGSYRVVAWAEQFGDRERAPQLYVRLETRYGRGGQTLDVWLGMTTWPARVGRAPWWQPWARRHELLAVVERAITRIETLENRDRAAAVTLEAVAEALDPTAPAGEQRTA